MNHSNTTFLTSAPRCLQDRRRALQPYRQKKQAKLWHDYGPTLAVEELADSC
jgi:hypothetical protein